MRTAVLSYLSIGAALIADVVLAVGVNYFFQSWAHPVDRFYAGIAFWGPFAIVGEMVFRVTIPSSIWYIGTLGWFLSTVAAYGSGLGKRIGVLYFCFKIPWLTVGVFLSELSRGRGC